MRYNKLDLNLLFPLRALLIEKNVTRAGEAMCITQSAMSGILARLRDYFDDPLIVQVGRRMELTPLAESLLEPLHDSLMRIDATIATRPDFNPQQSRRHFSLVASDYVANILVVDVLCSIPEIAPGITVELRQPGENSAAELEAGEVDFIILPQRFVSLTHSSHALFEDTYAVVVDRDNPRVADTITLEQYLELGHVAFQSVRTGVPMFETWFSKEYGDGRRVEISAPSFHLLPRLVIGNERVATLHTRFAQQQAASLPIRLVRPLFEIPRLVEVLQWHKYRDLDPGSAWLRDQIISRAQALSSVE